MISTDDVDNDGWLAVQSWGGWELQVPPECDDLVLVGPGEYWIDSERWDEPDWEVHMSRKGWVCMCDFREALSFCRSLNKTDIKAICRAMRVLRATLEIE